MATSCPSLGGLSRHWCARHSLESVRNGTRRMLPLLMRRAWRLPQTRAFRCRDTLCQGRTLKRAHAAKWCATCTPFTHYCRGGRLECSDMLMLRTHVFTMSCILMVNLPNKEMA